MFSESIRSMRSALIAVLACAGVAVMATPAHAQLEEEVIDIYNWESRPITEPFVERCGS